MARGGSECVLFLVFFDDDEATTYVCAIDSHGHGQRVFYVCRFLLLHFPCIDDSWSHTWSRRRRLPPQLERKLFLWLSELNHLYHLLLLVPTTV